MVVGYLPRGMVIVNNKTFWIFRSDDFNLKVRAKHWYWEKAGYIFKDRIFQFLNFTVSLLTEKYSVPAPSNWLVGSLKCYLVNDEVSIDLH